MVPARSNRISKESKKTVQPRAKIWGATRRRQQSTGEYWALVHRLMNVGWYRLPDHKTGSLNWGFHEGHTVPHSGGRERWIHAEGETAAMGIFLRELHG